MLARSTTGETMWQSSHLHKLYIQTWSEPLILGGALRVLVFGPKKLKVIEHA